MSYGACMTTATVPEAFYVIKVDELPALNYLNPDHSRPVLAEWINRGTDQKMRRSTIDQLLRTLNEPSPSPSVSQMQQSAGLRLAFATDADRDNFANAFSAARLQLGAAHQHHVTAVFDDLVHAERVVEQLLQADVPRHAITVLSRAGQLAILDDDWRGHSKSSVAAAVTGGGLTGALFGIGVLALVPAAAPIAAFSSVASVSAIFGATGGAMLRMLTDKDVDGREANYYEKQIRRGRVFVTVDSRMVAAGIEPISAIFKQAVH